MPLPVETGSKKHILAEGMPDPDWMNIPCRLHITGFNDFTVLSVYSDLSPRLLAYKVLINAVSAHDNWLDYKFARKLTVDLNLDYELLPAVMKSPGQKENSSNSIFTVNPPSPKDFIHFSCGLEKFNAGRMHPVNVYLFSNDQKLNVLIFKEHTPLFCNTFLCRSETERLYFLKSALEISGIPAGDAVLYLDVHSSGDTASRDLYQSVFETVHTMQPEHGSPDRSVEGLGELLFFNYLIALCA